MIRCFSFDEVPKLEQPIFLTIGNFDGVHLGHQKLLSELKKRGKSAALITFSNHPATFFRPEKSLKLLCTLEERLERIEKMGIDLTLVLSFDKELSHLTYIDFLEKIREKIPFEGLVLGEGATFGKERKGTAENLKKIGIEAEYIPKIELEGHALSSGQIRKWQALGERALVERALKHP